MNFLDFILLIYRSTILASLLSATLKYIASSQSDVNVVLDLENIFELCSSSRFIMSILSPV